MISYYSFIQDLSYTYGSDISTTGWKRSANGTRMAYDFSYDGLGYDTREMTWTYTGQPATAVTTRSSSVSGVPASQTRTWSYDHVDRLTAETLSLPGTTTATLATYTYDNLGRLAARKLAGSTTNAENYTYDVRSRTTGISHPDFIQDLSYTYGSDVSASGWKRSANGTRKGYVFTYDGLHRLKNANYREGSTQNNHYSERITSYDRNGNIISMQRFGRTGASTWGRVDSLSITRTGNKLKKVTDGASASPYAGGFHFTDGANKTTEYTYDSNGALISDANRKITSITWNEIDLPKTVTFSTGSTINYFYAADGTKLREVRAVKSGSTTTTTTIDWVGDLVLEKVGSGTRSAKRLRLDGGYVDLATGVAARRHFIRDHLGSVRAVVDDAGTVLETDDYYPLGGPLPTGSSTDLQPEKYQGKEWNPAASFNVYDFGARLYDPALGRWLSQDPLAEKYYNHSLYLFCAANPMKFVDPTGEEWYSVYSSGHIMVVDEEKDGPDRLYSNYPQGGIGPMMSNDYIEVFESGLLESLSSKPDKLNAREDLWSTSEEMAKIFSFVSRHSNVEWLIRSFKREDGSMYYNLVTDHDPKSVTGRFVDRRLRGVSIQDMYAHIHSHPGETYTPPSGDFSSLLLSEISDAVSIRQAFIDIYGEHAPMNNEKRPFFYSYHPASSSLTRYTMYNKSYSRTTIQNQSILKWLK